MTPAQQHIYHQAKQAAFEKRYSDAETLLQSILQQNSIQLESSLLLGRIYFIQGDYKQSYQLLSQLLEHYSECGELYYLLGKLSEKLGQSRLSPQDYFSLAIKYDPCRTHQFALLYTLQNKAVGFAEIYKVLQGYDAFLRAFPNDLLGLHNRSQMLKEVGLYDLAICDARKTIEISPDFAMGWCNLAMLLNSIGEYKEGWQAYEWRWKTDVATFKEPQWPIPRWEGQAIGDDKLLIYAEQGFGDNIQFVRYAIEAKQRGMNILVVNHTGVENLLNANLARYGIETLKNGTSTKGVKHYVSMMSLPHYFGTTLGSIPFPTAYLQAQPEFIQKFAKTFPKNNRLQVGIVWAGTAKHSRDKQRSIRFEQLKELLTLDADFHCLQKEISQVDQELAARFTNLTLHHQTINDFSDTAGLIEHLDLIISVDTSVAHLAAAMGKKTWIMLTYQPDYRWLLEREDSPWYENVHLFRQNLSFDWWSVLLQVSEHLEREIRTKKYD